MHINTQSVGQNTLNLPRTAFPMKANLPKKEPEILQRWQTLQLYERLQAQTSHKRNYSLHDGPPYANGPLHLGHAVNKILKDIILKSKRLSGYHAPFIPGWDCHGLPIELNVEKALKARKQSYTSQDFRTACRQYAGAQIAIQKETFKRLGVLADWENPYLTMDPRFEANIVRTLGQCIQTGYLKAGFKPVHWCIHCASALAELEVEYKDKTSSAIDVRFVINDPTGFPGKGPLSIPIWTTTPWTLPANAAVAIGPSIQYSLVQTPQERFILAHDLFVACMARYGISDWQILSQYSAKQLVHLQLQHPFEHRAVPLVASDHVLTDTGTGAVHIAPEHGQEDYGVGLTYQLTLRQCVDGQGYYQNMHLPALNQQSVLSADAVIIDLLKQQSALLCEQSLVHSYPHCWRHKTPLIFLATPQWFLDLQQAPFRKQLTQAIQNTQWIPEWGQTRMRLMVGEQAARPDWCLSRQRLWGVPIPLFVHHKTGQWHPRTLEFLETIATAIEKTGIEAWYHLSAETLLGSEVAEYRKLTDVLDVWFDSGVTHHVFLKQDERVKWPADLYLEGADQFRGWFQSSLLTSVALTGQAPYRAVLSHGFTVDEQGRKMSKSLGNVVALDALVQKWGVDVLRLWIAATDTRTEITLSDETLKRMGEAYRRIRNTLRFLLGNLHQFNPAMDVVSPKELLSIDRWILLRAAALQQEIQTAYEQFNFPTIYKLIHNFCINELGSFYFSVLKDRLYTMPAKSLGRRAAQTALYQLAETLLRWLAPILSFTAEEAWTYLPGVRTESVFLTEWYPLTVEESADALQALYQEMGGCLSCWTHIIAVKELVNKAIEAARNQGLIGSGLESIVEIICPSDTVLARLLTQLMPELHFIFLTSAVQLTWQEKGKHPTSNAIDVLTGSLGEMICLVKIRPVEPMAKKCNRCWHRREDVNQDTAYPGFCRRCVDNVKEGTNSEQRYYA
jgi:isoleucyl-tRNA synthetase